MWDFFGERAKTKCCCAQQRFVKAIPPCFVHNLKIKNKKGNKIFLTLGTHLNICWTRNRNRKLNRFHLHLAIKIKMQLKEASAYTENNLYIVYLHNKYKYNAEVLIWEFVFLHHHCGIRKLGFKYICLCGC